MITHLELDILECEAKWALGSITTNKASGGDGQEAIVKIEHGTTDWFQIGKGVYQGYILSPCLFNLYVEYIMRNAGPEEAQAGIKIARRNINNVRYADDTTLMAESEEELKHLLMKVKEENEKVSLKLNIRKLRSWHPVPSLHGK